MSKVVYFLYSTARKLYLLNIPILPFFIKIFIRLAFNCFLPYKTVIKRNTLIAFGGLGTVIHEKAIIGESCYIGSGVTIGGTTMKEGAPRIGNKVYIGTGAKLLGPIEIGDNVVIGANAVVLHNIKARTMVGGIPAKIIKNDINIANYHNT